jgi:hypothetical protein
MLEEANVVLEEDDDALEGKVRVSPLQLRRIVNLGKTNISLDGSDSNTGGQPAVIYSNSRHVNPGKSVSKAGQGITMIGGSMLQASHFLPTSSSLPKHKPRKPNGCTPLLLSRTCSMSLSNLDPEKI